RQGLTLPTWRAVCSIGTPKSCPSPHRVLSSPIDYIEIERANLTFRGWLVLFQCPLCIRHRTCFLDCGTGDLNDPGRDIEWKESITQKLNRFCPAWTWRQPRGT